MTMTWRPASESPTESGYYLTYYYNFEQEDYFYKAFCYNTKTREWMFRFRPFVEWYWDKRFDFYVPCQTQQDLPPPPLAKFSPPNEPI